MAEEDTGKGFYTEFFDDGQRKFEIAYEHAKLNGPIKRWDAAGTLLYEAVFVDDVEQGPYTRWHPNGEVSEEGSYRDGKRHGSVTMYNEDGDVLIQLEFANGEPVFDEETQAMLDAAEAAKAEE
jgi:antitoxin component YwqK of YwqJK toxin-antitoxin module